jgi:hypothetical protein
MVIIAPKSSVRMMRVRVMLASAARVGVRPSARSWQPAQRCV